MNRTQRLSASPIGSNMLSPAIMPQTIAIDDDNHNEDSQNSGNTEHQQSQSQQETSQEAITSSALSPKPSTGPDMLDEISDFLMQMKVITAPVRLDTAAEQRLYQLFQDNTPRVKTAITGDPSFKIDSIKPKQIEDALIKLIDREIIIGQTTGGSTVFYLNQSLLPKIQSEEDKTALKEKNVELNTELNRLKVSVTAARSKKTVITTQSTTSVLAQQVRALETQIREKNERIKLLRTLSADPNYMNELKTAYATGLVEWKKRKRLAMELTEPYLATVQKKQRHWFKELGCELEDSSESIMVKLEDYVTYAVDHGIINQQGQPLLNQTHSSISQVALPKSSANMPGTVSQPLPQIIAQSKTADALKKLQGKAGVSYAQATADVLAQANAAGNRTALVKPVIHPMIHPVIVPPPKGQKNENQKKK